MEVLNYSFQTLVESPQHFLTLLQGFAVDNGWTTIEKQNDVSWASQGGGTYGWSSGNDNYLEIDSDGYGNQPLRYRIWTEYDDGDNTWLYVSGARPDNPEYDTSNSWTPGLQLARSWWCPESSTLPQYFVSRHSMPSGRIPSVWFWGDDKLIIVILQITAILYQSFAIGSPRLLDEFQSTTELQGLWLGKYSQYDDHGALHSYWSDYETRYYRWFWCFSKYPNPSGSNEYSTIHSDVIWWDGAPRGCAADVIGYPAEYAVSLGYCCTDTGTYEDRNYATPNMFTEMENIVCYNTWTDKYAAVSPLVFVKNYTGAYPAPPWYCIGTFPFIYIPWKDLGLVPGETITFGLDKYKAFPLNCYLDDYGVALRYE